jgi:hypothetical protein
MTRQEFLALIGTGVLVLVGLRSLLDHLLHFSAASGSSTSDYAVGRYGGSK